MGPPLCKTALGWSSGPGLPGASRTPLVSCPSVPASARPLPPLASPPSVGCTALGFKGRPRGPSWRARAPGSWPSSALSLFRSRPCGPRRPLPPSLRPSGAQYSPLPSTGPPQHLGVAPIPHCPCRRSRLGGCSPCRTLSLPRKLWSLRPGCTQWTRSSRKARASLTELRRNRNSDSCGCGRIKRTFTGN